MTTSPIHRGVLSVKTGNESVSAPAPSEITPNIFESNVITKTSIPIAINYKRVKVWVEPKPSRTISPHLPDIYQHIPKGGIFPMYFDEAEEQSLENETSKSTIPTQFSPLNPLHSPLENFPLSPELPTSIQASPKPVPMTTTSATTKVFRARVVSPVQKENVEPSVFSSTVTDKNFRERLINQTHQVARTTRKEDLLFLQFPLEI
jgi:hypothetical protein